MKLTLAAALIAAPAAAGTVTMDNIVRTPESVQAFVTVTPDRPALYSAIRCFLLADGVPVAEARDTSFTAGKARLAVTFSRPPDGKALRVECDGEAPPQIPGPPLSQ